MINKVSKILLARSDNIGDVVFTTPMAALLKKQFPECRIVFLVRNYTKPILQYFNDIDHIITLDDLMTLSFEEASQEIARYDFDVFINVCANPRIAKLAKSANIPIRIGTCRRFYHWLYCNHRINFSRKKSDQHETQLNIKLLEPLGISSKLPLEDVPINAHAPAEKKWPLFTSSLPHLASDKFNLIVHPGSNGNGREWPIEHYIELMRRLEPTKYSIYITGSQEEQRRFSKIKTRIPDHAHFIMGKMGLEEFCLLMAKADGIIASGTGPLHFAAALGTRTLGLFPPSPTAGVRRWKPLGRAAEYLAKEGTCLKNCRANNCHCMLAISVNQVLAKINAWVRPGDKLDD